VRITARVDSLCLEDPASGSRRVVQCLARDSILISRDCARNLMRRMGLRAIYQKPRTTVLGEPSERFPCLVDLQLVPSPDQVWATDINYITHGVLPGGTGEWPLASGRKPQIFHFDQGCQFNSTAFVGRLKAEEIEISLSRPRRCYDVILVERL
jgi:putative transposase